ncbi:NAD(P)/FAD-dependent oxidoreductase [Oceanobacillus caeni]|uniref:flavin-containing monooxygenase n=1 Tax=Oceanobacillus caeni TaxID=405946 RepID=UPI002E20EF39|nr:NAD(P)/FAD-dependent oxidoreductase [Oceanobacillus caeni]
MSQKQEFDAVIIGAGFSGMYMLHLLRQEGYTARLYEAGNSVGGTWYWNQYPGARCDTPSEFYCYTFSEALYKDWTWSSLYPRQEEILDYLNYAADKLELRQDIQLNTRVTLAEYDESVNRWKIETEDGNFAVAKYFIPAIGGLAVPHTPDIKGIENFKGEQYHTSRWPHEKVDFRGKRVGVIGTGSSGVQAITAIAKEADHLTVFQRTPHHTFQIRNPLLSPEEIKKMKEDFPKLRQRVLEHPIGMPSFPLLNNYSALDDSPEERTKLYERVWEEVGGFQFLFAYNDLITNDEANKTLEEFMHCKIKEIVKDPETANNLLPNHLIGGKRPICVSNYLETYNRENVTLVNLKKTLFVECTNKALRTTSEEYDLDIIVFATGFDAMTGALMNANIRGRNGLLLRDKWEGGNNLKTYLGICNVGFPNMFTIGGPHFPLQVNVPPIVEIVAEWIFDCIKQLDENGFGEIEATPEAEEEWTNQLNEIGKVSVFSKVDSWYVGANIEGKPRGFLGHPGDFSTYQEHIYNSSKDYKGFKFTLYQSSTSK